MIFNNNLFLVRHGETEFNKAHIIQGYTDSNLTELGLKQAEKAAQKAKDLNIDVLVCSDLPRAVKTSEIISRAIDIPIKKKDSVFRERDWGKYDGKDKKLMINDFPQYLNKDGIFILEHDFPTTEHLRHFYNRIINGVKSLLDEFPGKNILLVGHKGTLNMVYAYAHNIPLDKIRTVYNAENCVIENY